MAARKKPNTSSKAEIPWAKLAVVQGKATKIPALLRATREQKGQLAACGTLAKLLVDEGQAYEATSFAFAELATIALDTSVAERSEIVDLLLWTLTLGEPGERDLTGIDLSDHTVATIYAPPAAKALLDAAIACAPKLCALLSDRDALVRSRAAHLLGLIPSTDPSVVAALESRYRGESSPAIRLSMALALSYRGLEGTLRDSSIKAISSLLREEKAPLPKGALAAAHAIASRAIDESTTEEDLQSFFMELARSQRNESFGPSISWNGGAVDGLVIHRFTLLGPRAKDLAARSLASALSHDLGGKPFKGFREQWPQWILREYFPARPLVESPAPVDDFESLQLELLRRMSQWPNEGLYEAHGLPSDIRSRRRVLRMDPPSIMERPIRSPLFDRSVQVWRVFKTAKKGLDSLKNRPDSVAVIATVDEAGVGALTPSDRLDAWMESTARAYGTDCGSGPILQLLTTVPAAERVAFVSRWVAEIRRCPWPQSVEAQAWIVLWAALKERPELPAELDDIVNLYGERQLRDVLAAIPPERRERIAMREIEKRSPVASRVAGFADLMPKAAKRYEELEAAASE